MHLFAYGSLMFKEVWSKVVSGTYEKRQGRLFGYSRREILGETYPALVPGSQNDWVDGTVYFDLNGSDIGALDRFEGDQYRRRREICQLADGGYIIAWVFVFKSEYGNRVSPSEWCPEQFVESGIASFLSRYQGFQ